MPQGSAVTHAGSRVRLVIDHDRLAMAGGKLDVARATLGLSIKDVGTISPFFNIPLLHVGMFFTSIHRRISEMFTPSPSKLPSSFMDGPFHRQHGLGVVNHRTR